MARCLGSEHRTGDLSPIRSSFANEAFTPRTVVSAYDGIPVAVAIKNASRLSLILFQCSAIALWLRYCWVFLYPDRGVTVGFTSIPQRDPPGYKCLAI